MHACNYMITTGVMRWVNELGWVGDLSEAKQATREHLFAGRFLMREVYFQKHSVQVHLQLACVQWAAIFCSFLVVDAGSSLCQKMVHPRMIKIWRACEWRRVGW